MTFQLGRDEEGFRIYQIPACRDFLRPVSADSILASICARFLPMPVKTNTLTKLTSEWRGYSLTIRATSLKEPEEQMNVWTPRFFNVCY
jgi:hypothetical protein